MAEVKPGLGGRTRPTVDAWAQEPELAEERPHWDHDGPAWRSWNKMSPELEFCELAAAITAMAKPAFTIETGVGQGFTTRRVKAALAPGATLKGFESDASWRERLRALPFFDGVATVLAEETTPTDADLAAADFMIADAARRDRVSEVTRWAELAKPGSMVLVHDTGNRHPEWTPHHALGELIESLGIPGVRFPNPRGAFLGQR